MLKSTPMPEGVAATDIVATLDRMTEHDLLEVVEIEQGTGLSHWGWDAYHTELQSQADSLMLVMRAATGERAERSVLGFIVARCLADEIHINNVAVRPGFRRKGFGHRLLQAVLVWGRKQGAGQAVLEVRDGNKAAQELYRACGFEVIGRRRKYYKDPLEDALLMAVSLKQNA
jgi:ribosomal-protein-alanine N-acetyltransferase